MISDFIRSISEAVLIPLGTLTEGLPEFLQLIGHLILGIIVAPVGILVSLLMRIGL
ncbi:hypothetical protein ACFL1X_03785 [Candidatus Hydrogenedentota bacterium]